MLKARTIPRLNPATCWLRGVAFFFAALLAFGLVGCKEAINPYTDTSHRQNCIFFNYSVPAPEGLNVVLPSKPKLDGRYAGQSIHLLAGNHFIPTTVTEQFQKATGARIIVDTYDSTTELRERLRSGEKADLILTASFMIEQLRDEDRLVPLEKKNIPDVQHLDQDDQHPVYDSDLTYCVPYLWSAAGIAYNSDALDVLPQEWADLLIPTENQVKLLRNRVSILPVPQRAYAMALIHLGYSINTKNQDEIVAAEKLLSQQNDILRFKFGRAAMIDGLATGELLMAEAYSNEAALAQTRNRSVRFCLPEEGSWVTHYCFALPATSQPKAKELAEAFVNFLLQPTVAADVVNYSLCASTIPAAQSYVRANVRLGPTYMLPTEPSKRYVQAFTPETEELSNRLWQELTGGIPMDLH